MTDARFANVTSAVWTYLYFIRTKLCQPYNFNKSRYKFDYFVDYGGISNEETDELADDALVWMCVPLIGSWVQPIATFTMKSAALGRNLAELVLEANTWWRCEHSSLFSAGNNRSTWQQTGISGSLASPSQNIPHLCIPEGKCLYFLWCAACPVVYKKPLTQTTNSNTIMAKWANIIYLIITCADWCRQLFSGWRLPYELQILYECETKRHHSQPAA